MNNLEIPICPVCGAQGDEQMPGGICADEDGECANALLALNAMENGPQSFDQILSHYATYGEYEEGGDENLIFINTERAIRRLESLGRIRYTRGRGWELTRTNRRRTKEFESDT